MSLSLKPSLNWLFAFIPISLALEYAHVPPPVLFFSAALAIVPIASLIVHSTEQLATYTGDAIGGLLNATFGNAPELIIAMVALRAGFFDMVRASIIGAILANLLLATGVAFLLGGLRYHTQEYNSSVARLYSSMMLISAISLGIPSAFNRFFSPEGTLPEEKLVNLGTAVILLAAYGLYLVFLIKTHPDYFQSAAEKNNTGAGTCTLRSTSEMGMNRNSQSSEGLSSLCIEIIAARRARRGATSCRGRQHVHPAWSRPMFHWRSCPVPRRRSRRERTRLWSDARSSGRP